MINQQVKKPTVAKKKKIKTPGPTKSIVDPRDAVRKEQKDSTGAAALQARIARLEKQLATKPKMPMPPAMMDDGGLLQQGGTKDPVSGNDVPVGSTKKEVRDDIPAQLSEGEFVFPADVVRFIGLNNLMKLRQEAKEGLGKMDRMGQMGNSEEATEDDTGEFDSDIDSIIKEVETEMASQTSSKDSIETVSETEEALPVKKKSIADLIQD
tara:strand:- start:555 stop:1184 length:630 start_codon:yes stop_codon:yes gene_type:complete